MPAFLRTITGRAAPALRQHIVAQRANVSSKPGKDKCGVFETVVGFGSLSLAILAPSGWVLVNIENYKNKQ